MYEVRSNQLSVNIEGFWTLIFSAGPNSNGGVAALKAGLLYGGDNEFFYVGSYEISADRLHAQVDCRALTRSAVNIFGTKLGSFALRLDGQLQSDGSISAIGSVETAPHIALTVRMTKRLSI